MTSSLSRRSAALLAVIASAGVVVGVILSLEHFRLAGERGAANVCGRFGPGCAGALASADAFVAGIPVAFVGTGWWAALLAMTLLAMSAPASRGGWAAAPWPHLFAAAGAIALLPAAWFTFKLLAASGRLGPELTPAARYALCPFCLASHALTLVFFLAALVVLLLAGRAEARRRATDADLDDVGAADDDADPTIESPWSRNPMPGVALVAGAFVLTTIVALGMWRTTRLEARQQHLVIERLRELPGAPALIAVNSLTTITSAAIAQAVADMPPPSVGPADARVTIRDFVDMNCNYCYDSLDKMRHLVADFDGAVRLEVYHFPGSHECNPHYRSGGMPLTCDMALGAIATYVGGEGTPEERNARYWRMVDAIIARYRAREAGLPDPAALAERAGMPRADFAATLASDAPRLYLRRDTDLGARIPVRAFPTVLFEERIIERDATLDDLREVIRELMARSGDGGGAGAGGAIGAIGARGGNAGSGVARDTRDPHHGHDH